MSRILVQKKGQKEWQLDLVHTNFIKNSKNVSSKHIAQRFTNGKQSIWLSEDKKKEAIDRL